MSPRRLRAALAAILAAVAMALCAWAVAQTGDDAPSGAPAPPAHDAPLPRAAGELASRLAATTAGLQRAIDRWLAAADPVRQRPPEDVELWALDEQRLYRLLAGRPALARAVVARLPRRMRPAARDILAAIGDLRRLTPPTTRQRFRTALPRPPGELLRYYRKAQRRFGVAWHVLAAINFVETKFNRLRNDSVAGARGPMQFLPATWRAYGMGGNIRDPHDAILGAANYLRASGAPRNYRRALFAYNRSNLYVGSVLRYARRMERDVRSYYAFYSWQVFVRTPAGDRRLTGPGIR